MQSNNKLTIPDLISIGVFTAIYFVLVTIATFASALLLPGVSNIFLPAIAALISGSVYMLLAAKLQKFGGITIMGLVMGLFFFVSGYRPEDERVMAISIVTQKKSFDPILH